MLKSSDKNGKKSGGSVDTASPAGKYDNSELSAVRVVVDEIKRRLRTGELTPGQRLVASELAEELHLSRVPVREALHVLAGEGVIDLQLNRSARVRPITARDLVDMLTLLSALGKLALALAAQRMPDPKQRHAVRVTIDEINLALSNRNSGRFFAAAHAFHTVINLAADNNYLKITYGHLHMDYFNRALSSRLPGDHWPEFEANYRAIGKALLAGDGKQACRRYEQHMDWAVKQLQKDVEVEQSKRGRGR